MISLKIAYKLMIFDFVVVIAGGQNINDNQTIANKTQYQQQRTFSLYRLMISLADDKAYQRNGYSREDY